MTALELLIGTAMCVGGAVVLHVMWTLTKRMTAGWGLIQIIDRLKSR